MATTVQALDAGNITTIGVVIILALVVIGVLLGLVITALLGRVVILVAVIVLAAFVWQQRGHVKDQISTKVCNTHPTFFGLHLDAPQDVKDACSTRS